MSAFSACTSRISSFHDECNYHLPWKGDSVCCHFDSGARLLRLPLRLWLLDLRSQHQALASRPSLISPSRNWREGKFDLFLSGFWSLLARRTIWRSFSLAALLWLAVWLAADVFCACLRRISCCVVVLARWLAWRFVSFGDFCSTNCSLGGSFALPASCCWRVWTRSAALSCLFVWTALPFCSSWSGDRRDNFKKGLIPRQNIGGPFCSISF